MQKKRPPHMDEENVILNVQCLSIVKDGAQEKMQNLHPKRVGYYIGIAHSMILQGIW